MASVTTGTTITQNKYTQGIQRFIVPVSGIYIIEARGASGAIGCYTCGDTPDATHTYGGRGAIIGGEFNLSKGEQINILVGQRGSRNVNNKIYQPGGGGGGTFVVKNVSDEILIIAGGGGGGGMSHQGQGAGYTGTVNESSNVYGGSPGQGGNVANTTYGSSGAGFSGDGKSRIIAKSFKNGGVGGSTSATDHGIGTGGFGGGGVGYVLPGGGGGYSGGGLSGYWAASGTAGGGGSKNNGANKSQNGYNSDHGKVIIKFKVTP